MRRELVILKTDKGKFSILRKIENKIYRASGKFEITSKVLTSPLRNRGRYWVEKKMF